MKGIHFIPETNDDGDDDNNNKDNHFHLHICSVGYDQRLTLWDLNCDQFNQNVTSTIQRYNVADKNCPLIWNKGSMVNVGDVNSLAVSQSNSHGSNSYSGRERFVGVIGEGFQVFRIS